MIESAFTICGEGSQTDFGLFVFDVKTFTAGDGVLHSSNEGCVEKRIVAQTLLCNTLKQGSTQESGSYPGVVPT